MSAFIKSSWSGFNLTLVMSPSGSLRNDLLEFVISENCANNAETLGEDVSRANGEAIHVSVVNGEEIHVSTCGGY